MIIYHFSNIIFLLGYDNWTDYQVSRRCKKLSNSNHNNKLSDLLSNLEPVLGALK